jgi:hypothetical protein
MKFHFQDLILNIFPTIYWDPIWTTFTISTFVPKLVLQFQRFLVYLSNILIGKINTFMLWRLIVILFKLFLWQLI